MKNLPAFKAAIVSMMGIAIGRAFPQFQFVLFALAVSSILLSCSWFYLRNDRSGALTALFAYTALLFAFGAYMTARTSSLTAPDMKSFHIYSAKVEESPRDRSSSDYLLSGCCGYDSTWHRIPGYIALHVDCPVALFTGEKLLLHGQAGTISSARNPGDFDLKSFYSLAGISGKIYLKNEKDLLAAGDEKGFDFNRIIVEPVRNSLREKIRKYLAGEEAELARGMLIGERKGLSRDVSQDFVNAGTVHILAVSGLHVGFLTGILMAIVSLLRIPRRFRFFAIAPVLIVYAFIIGLTPSITRAVIMTLVVLFGLFLQRKPQILNSLGFAALLILIMNPAQLYSPGFQLSFAAVTSIAVFHGRILALVRSSFPRLEERSFIYTIVNLSVLTVSATMGTVPLTAFYFSRISLVSVIANILVVPLSGLFVAMCFTFISLSYLWGGIASVFGSASQLIAFSILKINSVLGSSGLSSVTISDSKTTFAVLYFFWLTAVALFGGKSLWKKCTMAVLLGIDMIIFSSFVHSPHASAYFLDVGQGDAAFIRMPDGKNILVDAGVKFGRIDAGERVIVPFLKRLGVKSLDFFVLTHLHSDHIGGALSVVRNIEVKKIVYPDQSSQSAIWNNLLNSIRALRIKTEIARAGTILDSTPVSRIYILHPNRKYTGDGGYSFRSRLNDGSIVLKICVGKESMLLVGDAEKLVEHDLVNVYGNFMRSEFLKAGHHGSNTSSGSEFLGVVSPRYAVISVGARNSFGHPSPDVLRAMTDRKIKIWRTDSLGGAFVIADPDTLELVEWK